MIKKLLYPILYVAIFSLHIFAQQDQSFIIKGSVFDNSTNTPLIGVNVFISNTFVGTTSDTSGNFIIKNCPAGIQNLIFSIIGYQRIIQEINTAQFDFNKPLNIKLSPKSYELEQVDIVTDKGNWENLYDKFCKEFIGTREFGNECEILNPYSINLKYDEEKDRLTASCDSILVIENKALGYKIELLLDSFVWDFEGAIIKERGYRIEPRFIELTPEDEDELEEWEENRENAYRLSTRNFFCKLINRKVHHYDYAVNSCQRSVEQMTIFSEKFYVSALNIVHDKLNNFYEVPWKRCVSIMQFDGAQKYHSYIESMFGDIKINESFRDISTGPIVYTGYWSTFRVSDLLPDEYTPSQNE